MLLAEDLKDKRAGWEEERRRGIQQREREIEHPAVAQWQEPKYADQMLRICQSKQLSFQQAQRWKVWRLIIDKLCFSCFLTPSLSPSVSVSLRSLSPFLSLRIRHRLQHESCWPVFGSVTSDFAAMPPPPSTHPFTGISSLAHSLILSVLPISPPSVAMAPARSPQGPSYLHSSDCSTLVSILSSPASCQRKAGVRPLAVEHSRS